MTDPESLLRALVDAVTPLMDRDVVSAYPSAWEIDLHHGVNGEKLHNNLRSAWEAARVALGDA